MDLFDWIFKNFGKLWIASAVIGLAMTAVVIWAIVRITLHVTGS